MFKRILQLKVPEGKSAFLWGPRKTGKTTLLKNLFNDATYIDLLDTKLQFELTKNPHSIYEMCLANKKDHPIIIDEIQKIPILLDEVQRLIENEGLSFILSGSSARKLRRQGSNLLGGRAWRYELAPLVSAEIPNLNLIKALESGLLPSHYLSEDPQKDLAGYVYDYLNEEIKQEALTRNIPAFSRFLENAAFSNGELLNYANIARDCGVSSHTVREFYQILVDTFLGFIVEPWRKSKKRKLIETSKFYFFDVGVAGILSHRGTLHPKTEEFGKAFEHFIFQEIVAYSKYREKYFPISFWRTKEGVEVDFVLGKMEAIIEIKSKDIVTNNDIKGLKLFIEENGEPKRAVIISRDEMPKKFDKGIIAMNWKVFCQRLWNDDII